MKRYKTIDAHVAGEPMRLIIGGGPSVPGGTMTDKLMWLRRHGNELRRCLMLEPRGHAGMHGALLTEPVTSGAHAGLLSMHAAGFPRLSGEAVIAATTIALENGILQGETEKVVIDSPVGQVQAQPRYSGARVVSVAMEGIPSYVQSTMLTVRIGSRSVHIDIAFGGEVYAIVDAESLGLPVDIDHGRQMVALAAEIKESVKSSVAIDGVVFTSLPRTTADLRSATVLDGGVLRRSPGVTSTSAVLAVLDGMGVLTEDHTFRHEGLMGTVLRGKVIERKHAGEESTVTPMIEGSAWITGRHEFVVDDKDDYRSSAAAT
jgi:proline racemase